jgi:hypothetical protein
MQKDSRDLMGWRMLFQWLVPFVICASVDRGFGLTKALGQTKMIPRFQLEVSGFNLGFSTAGFPGFGSYCGFFLRVSSFRFCILSAPVIDSTAQPILYQATGASAIAPSNRSYKLSAN